MIEGTANIRYVKYASIALYGAETWTLRKVDQKYLESFEMWCICCGLNIMKLPIMYFCQSSWRLFFDDGDDGDDNTKYNKQLYNNVYYNSNNKNVKWQYVPRCTLFPHTSLHPYSLNLFSSE
jgi:hypothetical protein